MYPVSNTVKALFEAEQRQVLRITGTDKNGTSISITEANVMENGFNIDRASVNGDKLEVGTAIASELTLKLDNREGQFDGVVFEGTELFVEIGIADWTQTTPTVSWIPCGYFTPDEQPRSLSTITIHALDRMMNFDKVPPTLTPWTDNYGNIIKDNFGEPIYFFAEIAFPTTVNGLIEQTCARCSVPFTQTITSLPNYDYQIASLPNIQQEITFRNIIQWCAGILACNAWIDWTGELRFSWYGATTNYATTVSNRYSSDLHEDDIEITGVQYTNTQGVTIVSGDADYTIDMTGNYLAMTGVATIMPAVKNVVAGFTYRPFEASVINAPYLWPMDMITFTKGEDDFTCAVTNVNFGINGTTSLAGKGESKQAQSRIDPNGVTNEQGFLIETAQERITTLDNSLNQEGIFNRLTDNGEEQALILYQGKVYLNASYIKTGILDGELVKAKLLQILNSNNDVIASYDDTIILGKPTTGHAEVDYNSFELKDTSNNNYVFIGDLRNAEGVASLTESFKGNGEKTTFSLQFRPVASSVHITIDDEIVTNYTINDFNRFITFDSAPEANSIIVIQYDTTYDAYLFTFGKRRTSGKLGAWSIVIGRDSTASGAFSFAHGEDVHASGVYSFATGNSCFASGIYSFAGGYSSYATNEASHAEGRQNTASGIYSHAEGYKTKASGSASHSECSNTTASGGGSHAEGGGTTASGIDSHAEGYQTTASGECSHTEGYGTVASWDETHAEGYETKASARCAHAEGEQTTASGSYSHAEGYKTIASGMSSHAEGEETTAKGQFSHAEGYGTYAKANYQHVFGRYNVIDTDTVYLEIAGYGSSNQNRQNVRTLSKYGDEWIAASLTQGSDARCKDDTGEIPDVSAIKAHKFKWNDKKGAHDDIDHIGYYAQDVEKVAPYLVSEDANGFKSLDYIGFLCAKIESLEKRIAELENK